MASSEDTRPKRGHNLLTATELVLQKLTEPAERSKQRSVGPSEIGGCPKCLAKRLEQKLTGDFTPSDSSLASWMGTAVHYFLEHELGLGVSEQKAFVHHLDGYGDISGHIDLTLNQEVVDFKVVGKASYDKMQLAYRKFPDQIPTTQYRVQQMLYAYGLRQQGIDVEYVNLLVFPKHKSGWSDVATFREYYNQEVVDKALDRLQTIWDYVRAGELDQIPSDEDCYTCNMKIKIKRKTK